MKLHRSFPICLFFAAAASSWSPGAVIRSESRSGISVQIDEAAGRYAIESREPAWRFAGFLGAPATSVALRRSADSIGTYQEVSFRWKAGVDLAGEIRLYDASPVVLFRIESESAAPGAELQFPKFLEFPRKLGHFSYQEDAFAPPAFDLENNGTPWLLFDESGDSAILSPASNFMTATMIGEGQTEIGCGLNSAVATVPAHFSAEAILAFGKGINATWDRWGKALTAKIGSVRPANDADIGLRYLGYWTDAGATYYYHYDRKIGYAQTLENLMEHDRKAGIPIRYLQLDSWWYYKTLRAPDGHRGNPKSRDLPESEWNRYGGLMKYEAHPMVFPDGLDGFHAKVGLPLITHNRWIDPASPYRQAYRISGVGAVDPRWWNHIMDYLHDSGVYGYEQDWLSVIYRYSPEFSSIPGVGEEFTGNMARAAWERGMSLQYCMALPRYFLQGAAYGNLTTIRVSSDRFGRERWDAFLYTSRLARSVGIWPWTDVFMSSETDNLLMATLSAGIVGPGDELGKEDAAGLRKVARADGVLVKPDAPLLPVDDMYLKDAQTERPPMVAWTYTDHGPHRTVYVLCYARVSPKAGGEGVRAGERGSASAIARQAAFVPASLGLHGEVAVLDVHDRAVAWQRADAPFAFTVPLEAVSYFEVAPVGKSGIAFFGDEGKFVSTGSKRIANVVENEAGMTVTVRFAAEETSVRVTGACSLAPVAKAVRGSLGAVRYDEKTKLFAVDVAPSSAVEAESGGRDPVRTAVIELRRGDAR